jgi:hypothetical protein
MIGPETDFDSCEGAWYKSESNTFWLNTGTEMKLNRKMVGLETDFDTRKGAWYKSDQSEYISRYCFATTRLLGCGHLELLFSTQW